MIELIMIGVIIFLGVSLHKRSRQVAERDEEIERLRRELAQRDNVPYARESTSDRNMYGRSADDRRVSPPVYQTPPQYTQYAPPPVPIQPVPPVSSPVPPPVPPSAITPEQPVQPAAITPEQPVQPAPVQPAPVPVPTPPPAQPRTVPTYTADGMYRPSPAAYVKPEKKVSPINMVLGLGTLFVVLAGFVFAAAAWSTLGAAGRIAVLLSFSVVFFILHIVTEKKFDLSRAGKVFYVLGSASLTAAVFAAAVMHLIDGFTFGQSPMLVLSVMAMCVCVCSLAGAVHYRSRPVARAGYVAATLAAAAMCLHISNAVGTVILSAAALLLMLAENRVRASESERLMPLTEEFSFFVTENIYVSALSALFITSSAEYILPALIFSASFLIGTLRGRHTTANISVFCGYLALSTFMSMRPQGVDNILLLGVLLITVYTVLTLIGSVPENVRRIVNFIRIAACVPVIITGVAVSLSRADFDPSIAISAAIVTAELLISVIYRQDKAALHALCPAFIFTAVELSRILPPDACFIAVAAAVTIYAAVISRVKLLHCVSADFILAVCSVCVFAAAHKSGAPYAQYIVWALCAAVFLICSMRETKVVSAVFRWALPVSVLLIYFVLPGEIRYVSIIVYLAASLAALADKRYITPFTAAWCLPMIAGFDSDYTLAAAMCLGVYFCVLALLDRMDKREVPFGGITDVIVCAYLGVLTIFSTYIGGCSIVDIWGAWVCLLTCSCICYSKVSRWAVPAALAALYLPVMRSLTYLPGETAEDAAVWAHILRILIYGIAAAVFVRLAKRDRNTRALPFICIFPMLLFTCGASPFLPPVLVICAAAISLMKPAEPCRCIASLTAAAAYVLSLVLMYINDVPNNDSSIYAVCALAVWLICMLIYAAEEHPLRYALPVVTAAGVFPVVLLSDAAAAIYIITALYTVGYLIYLFRHDDRMKTAFSVCTPLMLMPLAERAYEGSPMLCAAACAAIICILITKKGEERKTWRTAMLSVLLLMIFSGASFAAHNSGEMPYMIQMCAVWAAMTGALIHEQLKRSSTALSTDILMSGVLSAIPAVIVCLKYLSDPSDPTEAAFTIVTAVLVMLRLSCLVIPVMDKRTAYAVSPLCIGAVLFASSISPYAAALMTFASASADAYIGTKEGSRKGLYVLFTAFIECAWILAGAEITSAAVIAVSCAVIAVSIPSFITKNIIGQASGRYSQFVLPAAAALMMIPAHTTGYTALACSFALAAAACVNALMRKNTIPLAVMFPTVFIIMYTAYPPRLVFYLVLCAVLALAGRVIFRNGIIDGRNSDTIAISALTPPLLLMCEGLGRHDSTTLWAGVTAIAAVFLLMYRPKGKKAENAAVLTLAALMVLPVWWTQPFFTFPELIRTEAALFPVAAVLILLWCIHRDRRSIIGDIAFPSAIIMLVVLFIDAARTSLAFDAVFLGAVIIAVLGLSFIFRRKRWFALAAASAAAEAIIMTFKLWRSQAWWIYLLAAGVILIAAGLGNETRRRHDEQGKKSRLRSHMEQWKW